MDVRIFFFFENRRVSHEREKTDLPCQDQKYRDAAEQNLRVGDLQELRCLTHHAIAATLCLSRGGIS